MKADVVESLNPVIEGGIDMYQRAGFNDNIFYSEMF